MTFKITKMTQKLKAGEVKQKPVNLPEAHTCFNQLVLPGRFLPIFFSNCRPQNIFLKIFFFFFFRL